MIVAPIKRPLSIKNSPPSQKGSFFFAGTSSSTRSVPCRCLHPGFQNLSVRILIRSATMHPSGSRSRKKGKSGSCIAERFSLSRSEATFHIFLTTPGPESGPQKNIGTLSCPMGCDKIKGSKWANHCGLMTRADLEKDIRLDFPLRECNGVPTKLQGFEPPVSKDHRCSPGFIDRTVLYEKELDL